MFCLKQIKLATKQQGGSQLKGKKMTKTGRMLKALVQLNTDQPLSDYFFPLAFTLIYTQMHMKGFEGSPQ